MRPGTLIPRLAVLLALLAPAVAAGQPAGKVYRIGWLGAIAPTRPEHFVNQEAFLQSLREHGFVEGQNLVMERRYADGREERNAVFAAELVAMKVDLILAASTPQVQAAKAATSTIPIVFAGVAFPDRQGFVQSLARPGGNITGMSIAAGAEMSGVVLQLLKDTLPQRVRVAILWNPDNASSGRVLRETDVPAAKALGLTPIPIELRVPTDLEPALERVRTERAEALYAHLAVVAHRQRIAEFALQHRLPLFVSARFWVVQDGTLLSYGSDLRDLFRRAGLYAARILKGARPQDLPVEQPSKFELVINLRTARAIGVTIPPAVLARADEVLE